jgi:hypothetical protein
MPERKKSEESLFSKHKVTIIVVMFAVILIAVLIIVLNSAEIEQQNNKVSAIEISEEMKFIKDCYEGKSNSADCPELDTTDIELFEYLINRRGNEICNTIGLTDSAQPYKECFEKTTGCSVKYQLYLPIEETRDLKYYQVYQCNNGDKYFVYYHNIPPEVKIVQVDIPEELMSKLRL